MKPTDGVAGRHGWIPAARGDFPGRHRRWPRPDGAEATEIEVPCAWKKLNGLAVAARYLGGGLILEDAVGCHIDGDLGLVVDVAGPYETGPYDQWGFVSELADPDLLRGAATADRDAQLRDPVTFDLDFAQDGRAPARQGCAEPYVGQHGFARPELDGQIPNGDHGRGGRARWGGARPPGCKRGSCRARDGQRRQQASSRDREPPAWDLPALTEARTDVHVCPYPRIRRYRQAAEFRSRPLPGRHI